MENRRRKIYEIKLAYHKVVVCMRKFDQMILKINSIEKAIEEIEDKIDDATVDLKVTEKKLNNLNYNNNNNNNKNHSKYKALLRERIVGKKIIYRLQVAEKKWERAKKRIQENAKECINLIIYYLKLNPSNTRTKNRLNHYRNEFNVSN
jgi:septal ring factor EnvC (AmiA/AmiB activator)